MEAHLLLLPYLSFNPDSNYVMEGKGLVELEGESVGTVDVDTLVKGGQCESIEWVAKLGTNRLDIKTGLSSKDRIRRESLMQALSKKSAVNKF